ncbi:hypothetical protein P1X14_18640 [Sphingomonas sp. AOB5]|uniref:hypothetical protein n=1 Tax=Sphingomonas sp. AOB5 TaxID=3034017 RepID=UPI0023F86E09|nr:hypothetical protein [Sphingomonas sp. AOB5]MDF7777285.1 hypothetical protein [Sphingomonas sp. AOB5]
MTPWLTDDRRMLIAAALFAGWVASLALPAVTIFDGHSAVPMSGAFVLMAGWIGAMHFQFGWIANFALFAALWLLIRWRPYRRALRIAAALLALSALHSLDLIVHPEANGMRGAHAGYFLWLGVCLAAAAIAVFYSFQTITERHDQPV